MSVTDLETAAAALGFALVPLDMHADMLDAVLEAEELRCDLDRLTANNVEDAIAAGLGAR